MDGTILSQGTFVTPATIVNQYIQIPSGADFMWVRNYTQSAVNGAAAPKGVEYYWQRGMAAGTGIVKYYTNGSAVFNGDTLVSGGFTLFDASADPVGNPVATTASTNAVRPVVTTGSTAGIAVGTVVRMSNTAQTDVNGVDFVVGAVTLNTNFTLLTASNPLANVPGAIGGAGFYRIIATNPLFYPRRRVIVNITQAVNAQVSTSIAHGLTPGQQVRFSIPALQPAPVGMIQLDGVQATILTVVDDYNFTINVDTTAFALFVFPAIAQQPSSYPLVIPFGEDTATSLITVAAQVPTIAGIQINNTNTGILADSTVNTGFLGMILGTGGLGVLNGVATTGPAGSVAADRMYWVVGKSSLGGL